MIKNNESWFWLGLMLNILMVYALTKFSLLTIIFRGFLADVCLVGVQLLFKSKVRNIHRRTHTHTHMHTHTQVMTKKRSWHLLLSFSSSIVPRESANKIHVKVTPDALRLLHLCVCVCVCVRAHLDAIPCMFSYPPENTYTHVSMHLCVCVFSWPRLWQRWMRQRRPCKGLVCFCVSDLWPQRGRQRRTRSPTVH